MYCNTQGIKSSRLKLEDIDLIELNEAFAAQALAVIQEAKLDPKKVNVNGGAIALGHPLGCTGAKLSIQLLDEMKNRNQRYGMVTACVGGVGGSQEFLNVYKMNEPIIILGKKLLKKSKFASV